MCASLAVNLLWICDDNFQSFSIFKSQAIFLLLNDYVCICETAREMAYEFPNEFQLITTRQNFIYCIRIKKKKTKRNLFACHARTYVQTDFHFLPTIMICTSFFRRKTIERLLAHIHKKTSTVVVVVNGQLMIRYEMTIFNRKSPWTFSFLPLLKTLFSSVQ